MIVRRVVALAVAGLALASCATTEAGTATPVESAAGEVPRVSEPLDATPFLDDPCSLVPDDALIELGDYESPKPMLPETDSVSKLTGPGCSWRSDSASSLLVGVQTENTKRGTGGMQGIYDAYHVRHWYSYYEPTEVAGYPAAYSDGADLRESGETALRVGITDDLTFSVNIGPLGEGKRQEAEDGARTIAEAVIKTLKAG